MQSGEGVAGQAHWIGYAYVEAEIRRVAFLDAPSAAALAVQSLRNFWEFGIEQTASVMLALKTNRCQSIRIRSPQSRLLYCSSHLVQDLG